MNQANRFCTYRGHQQFQAYLICTLQQCDIKTRWCCSKCIADQTHMHSMPDQNHLMDQQQVLEKVKQDREKLKIDPQGLQIEQLLSMLQKEFQKLREWNHLFHQDDQLFIKSLLKYVQGPNFFLLNKKVINKWLNINQQIQTQQELYETIQQQLDQVLQKLEEYQQNQPMKYEIQQIGIYKCESAIISKNQQFLVYNNLNVAHIYDIKQKKICKSINQKYGLSSFQFTQDSQQLFFGDFKGFVYGFQKQKEFKKTFRMKIHEARILQIIIKNQYLITCSLDLRIIKTDLTSRRQIFKLEQIFNFYQSMSMDYDNQKDLIIIALDEVITIWDPQNKVILIKYIGDCQFKQIKLLDNQQNIQSLDELRNQQKWKIDYQNNKLLELDQSKSFSKIYKGYLNYVIFYDQQKPYLIKAIN